MKAKPRRRPQHRASYYRQALARAPDKSTIRSLLSEAARQPLRLVSDGEYEELYWQAHDLLKRKGGCL